MVRWSWILLLGLACAPAPESTHQPSGEKVVAIYSGGDVELSEVEAAMPETPTPACLQARRARGGGSVEELLPCYADVARDLVLERLVLAEIQDPEGEIRHLENYPVLRRHAYLEVFGQRMNDEIEMSDEAIATYYELNRENYRQAGSLSLWNIFRRHEDAGHPEETLEFLREIKQRYDGGETFDSLARTYSHSETRLRGGQVGLVTEGRLPARLETAAFALGDGDVSDPIPVRGGAVLLHVRNVVRGSDLALTEVEGRIRRQLRAEAVDAEVTKRVADLEPPSESLVLDPEELIAALDGPDPETPVLDLESDILTVGEARQLVGLAPGEATSALDPEKREGLLDVYEQRRRQGLLAFSLRSTADADLRSEAESHLVDEGTNALVDQHLRARMETSDLVDEHALEVYYRDNLPHYQSPLRFQLTLWDLPFGSNPPRQLQQTEKLRQRLAAGEISELAAAVRELGGTTRDLGWRGLEEMPEITGKAREYLLQTETGGFSIPYQDDEALHMIWVQGREEPHAMSYEEAAEAVRADYLRRFEEQLFRQMADSWLTEEEFDFDEDRTRSLLTTVN